MTTFPSILRITFRIFFIIDCAFSQKHEALVIIDNHSTPNQAILPYEAVELDGQIIYPDFTKDGEKIEYSYLCPPQTPYIVDIIEKGLKKHPELAFWLEKKGSSSDKPPKCVKEVEPIFIKPLNSEGSEITCGKLLKQKQYNFGFSYVNVIKKPRRKLEIEPAMMNLYDICFDPDDSEALWTRHLIGKTSMLQEPGFPSQQIQPPYEFSTESYALPKETFSIVADQYKRQNEVKKSSKSLFIKSLQYFRKEIKHHRLIPQMMVPQKDLALKIWKKSTLHYANTAPLWDKLVPVMKAINDGLRKAGIAASIKNGDTIYIYTKAYPCGHHPKLGDTCFKSKTLKEHRFDLNIWCKFIYNESRKEGMMVFLHNIPDKPPKRIKSSWFYLKSKLTYKNIECGKQVSCDLRKWADDPAELSNNLLDYAYCCEVDNERAEEFFNIKFTTKIKLFDVDSIIDENSRQIVLK